MRALQPRESSSSTARLTSRRRSSRRAITTGCSGLTANPAGRSCPRRSSRARRGRRDQPAILALAVRGRSRRRGQGGPVQQRAGDHRRRHRAGARRRAACDDRRPRHRGAARAGHAAESCPDRGPAPNLPRLGQPTYWWLQVMGRSKPSVTAARCRRTSMSVPAHLPAPASTHLGSLSDERVDVGQPQPDRRASPAGRFRQPGIYD